MRIECHQVGPLGTNCYLLRNENTKEALVVDPGGCSDALFAHVKELELSIKGILLTHGHFDHIMGVEGWLHEYPQTPVYAGADEEVILGNPRWNLSDSFREYDVTVTADVNLQDEEEIELLDTQIRFLHTPGHTIGSGCYYLPEEKVLLSGDTLFCCSMGRTDFPTGNPIQMGASLRRLGQLPDDVRVLPGHDRESTMAYEKRHNPYIR